MGKLSGMRLASTRSNKRSRAVDPPPAAPLILIAEDDRRVRASLERALRLEGYEVTAVADGGAALKEHQKNRPDLMLLDVSMPNADGLSVCRMLRERGFDTQILMLTARHEVDDRVAGLDAGADDYLVKPFALEELLARVRARLRAGEAAATSNASHAVVAAGSSPRRGTVVVNQSGSHLELGDLKIDLDGHRVFRAGRRLHLSRTEFELLVLLVRNSGVVLSRFDIYDEIWDGELDVDSKTLDVYVGYLRRKTEADGSVRLIHTVRGVGYVARLDP